MSATPAPSPKPAPGPRAIFQEKAEPHDLIQGRGKPPPWRDFAQQLQRKVDQAAGYVANDKETLLVNSALYLRRPLLVTGKAGIGKSTLAHAVAHQLKLEEVLVWPITSRSTLQQGLYEYDAVARLQDAALAKSQNEKEEDKDSKTGQEDIGRYIRLGPLGTALYKSTEAKPCVLLIDEIDKSDIDLPNDLLHVFEEGEFEIRELSRLPEKERFRVINVGQHKGKDTAPIERGRVVCKGFPLVILTSNGEREFPPAFLRRCLRLDIDPPQANQLREIVHQRLGVAEGANPAVDQLITDFAGSSESGEMATDQLLNAVHLIVNGITEANFEELKKTILRPLNS